MESTETRKNRRVNALLVALAIVLALAGICALAVALYNEFGADNGVSNADEIGYYERAKAFYRAGNSEAARAVIAEGLKNETDPKEEYRARLLSGVIYDGEKRYNDALAVYSALFKNTYADEYVFHNAAVVSRKMGRINDAIDYYERALKKNTRFLPSLIGLGATYYDINVPSRAKNYFLRANTVAPENALVSLRLGILYEEEGNAPEAKNAFLDAAENGNPNIQALAYAYLGRIFAREGDAERAKNAYRASLRIHPNQSAVMYNLALLAIDTGDYGQAATILKEALTVNPDEPAIIETIGSLYYQAGNFDESAYYYKKLAALNGNDTQTLSMLGDLYLKMNDLVNAERAYKRILALARHDDAYYRALVNIGGIYAELGKPEEARAYYLRAQHENPNDPSVYYNLGSLYLANGVIEEGVNTLRTAFLLNTNDVTPLVRIGDFYRAQGDEQGARLALGAYREAERYNKNDAALLFNLGTAYYQANDMATAKRYFLYLTQIEPTDNAYRDAAFMNLAIIADAENDVATARTYYNNAIALKPETSLYLYNFGMHFYALGAHDQAFEQFNRALALNPNRALASSIYLAAGNALANNNDVASALELYERAITADPSNIEATENARVIRNRNAFQR